MQINELKEGDRFKVKDSSYVGKTFTVKHIRHNYIHHYIACSAEDKRSENDGQVYCFDQTNFDYYGDNVRRVK